MQAPLKVPRSQVPGSKRGRGPGPSSKNAVIPGPRIQKSRKRGPVPGPSPSYSSKRVLGPGPSSKKAIIPGPRTQKGSGPRSQDALGYLDGGLTSNFIWGVIGCVHKLNSWIFYSAQLGEILFSRSPSKSTVTNTFEIASSKIDDRVKTFVIY